jgi:hypothetical protein
MGATVVFLHGVAAAGKLTTGRALSDRLGYPLFHNHLVVDLLTTTFTFGTEPFVRLRERMWLDVMTDATRIGKSLVFTFAPEATVVPGFPERVRQAVTTAGGRVCFVRLLVGEAEQVRRVGLPDRRRFHKLSDAEVLRGMHRSKTVVEQPPADLTVDTEVGTPAETAAIIIDHFGLTAQDPTPRYPVSTT